jgi:hypothetical protein
MDPDILGEGGHNLEKHHAGTPAEKYSRRDFH